VHTSDVDWAGLAERVEYVGSAEHKDGPSFAGHPRPRADASLCDPALSDQQERVTRWLRTAVRQRAVSATMDGEFPRYVWYWQQGIAYEARVTNRERGQYKGYPLNRDEWPADIRLLFEVPGSEPAAGQ
jgi:hypothetical protein